MRLTAIILGLAIFGLDLVSKHWAKSTLPDNVKTIIEGFFRLHYVQNEGIAFGMFHDFDSGWKPIV